MDRPTAQSLRAVLLVAQQHVRIVHHLPGRIRLEPQADGVSSSWLRQHGPEGLAAVQRLLPGIRSLRFNALAGSAVLEYDPKLYPARLVEAFFLAASVEQAGDLLDHLQSFHP
jgi:hypothetical protein